MACIITYKGEEIPYEDWVQRLKNGLLDELINDGSIDISEFKGEIKPTPIEKKEEEIKLPKDAKEIFHYSENELLVELEDREGGTWFTENPFGYQFRKGVKGKVSKVIEPNNLKLASEKEVWKLGNGIWADGVKKIKEQGFDGIKKTENGDKYYLIFNLANLKNKSDYAFKEEPKKSVPKAPKQPTTQAEVKAKLIELGLTEEEAETSSRIYDVYVKNKAAKTGRSVEDVYGDIEFTGEQVVELNSINDIVEEVQKELPKIENVEVEQPKIEEPNISIVEEVDNKKQPINKVEDLQDVGEKIGGAKKDLAQKLSEVTSEDLETKPLSKVFPKPDFKKLVEEGSLSENGAILLNFLYDKIPAKPRKQYRVANWVRSVDGALQTTRQVLEAESTKNLDFTEKILKAVTLSETLKRDYKIYSDTMKGLGFPKEQVTLGGYEIRIFKRGNFANKPLKEGEDLWDNVYSIVSGSTIIGDFKTMDDAINGLKTILNKSEEKTKGTKFDIYQDRKTKEYFIGKKGAIDVVRVIEGFKTLGEARTFLKEKQADIQGLWDAMKAPKERRMANRPRVGIDWRKGKNIDSKEFADTFGFRGVEFGNWVNNSERQSHVNEAYDALMDLSSVLGVSPKALSLNGELGFAFGARGSGKANAHYE